MTSKLSFATEWRVATPSFTVFRTATRLSLVMMFALTLTVNGSAQIDNSLEKQASWRIPDAARVEQTVQSWIDESNLTDETSIQQIRTIIRQAFSTEENLPDSGSGTSSDSSRFGCEQLEIILSIVFPESDAILNSISNQGPGSNSDVAAEIEALSLPESARQDLRLLVARWMTQNDLFDEANQQFNQISFDQVLDPSALLFYHGLCCHRLLEKEKCVQLLERLNENSDYISRRFSVVSRLMLMDIEPLKQDSLDEIARMMDDIRRRQSFYRSGRIVRTKEEEVLKKLDKLIEELEKQQQMSASSSSNSSTPMKDSQRGGGMGSGNAKIKQQADGGPWGDLPPQQRAAALADMTKDLPPHYREVIEEYFRQLANEKK